MFFWAIRSGTGPKQLEGWLSQVLVPVEPNPRFVRRLRARLVHFRGREFPPVWFLAAVAATAILIVAAGLSYAFRLVLALVAVITSLDRLRAKKAVKIRIS